MIQKSRQHTAAIQFFGVAVLCFIFLIVQAKQVSAQAKSYSYDKLDFTFRVNEDSTVNVSEAETFHFQGNFHNAFRTLSLNKVDDITDIQVIDAGTNMPQSFTVSRENGAKKLEWHYDLTDTVHTWIITYTLHGAISFLKDHDELYWNLFTDFTVPVDDVHAVLILPKESDKMALQTTLYTSMSHSAPDLHAIVIDGKTFDFEARNVRPEEEVTIAAGWPKDIVDQGAYLKDVASIWWPVILGVLIFLGTILFAFLYWYRTEKTGKGKGTIVPQYEPPKNLRPAMAEVLVKEGISKKTWPATLIDLAVRGYVTIEEDKPRLFGLFGKDYIVKKKKDADQGLLGYEASYLDALFSLKIFSGELRSEFSTKDLKSSPGKSRALYQSIKAVEQMLYEEVDLDTNAYEKKISKEKKSKGLLILVFVMLFIGVTYGGSLGGFFGGAKFLSLFFVAFLSFAVVVWFLKYEARLSQEGAIMREDWLGFKLYLETAEKYRMQNLTPEIFEKYLPYAMIFGVEKKWAKNFDSLNMNPPSWYGVYGGYHAGSGIGSGVNSFSPSAFSSSLSSSFASAMGASGGSGASGGGGGAGGGGGGGGGGAS